MSAEVQDFITAMRAAGVDPVEPIAGKLLGGALIRFRCKGDGKKRNGWAVFMPVEPGRRTRARGRFGNHKQNTGIIEWWDQSAAPALTAEEREAMRRANEADAERRERELVRAQAEARIAAVQAWRAAAAASPDHPYAAKKRMRVGGLRQEGDALLVPMRDIEGRIWNLQRIYPDGSKRFMKGGRITGLAAVIGLQPGFVRGVFAEGFATGEAISQALGGNRPVVVAFNTANLDPVVAAWTAAHPRADWVIAADDDHLTGIRMEERGQPYQNPGIDKARAVAQAHGCKVAYPPSVAERWVDGVVAEPANTDFSDMLLAGGAEDIRCAIAAARRPAGVGQISLAERVGFNASSSAAIGAQGRAA